MHVGVHLGIISIVERTNTKNQPQGAPMKVSIRHAGVISFAVIAVAGMVATSPAQAAKAKANDKCTKVGAVKDGLVCTQVKNKRTYQKPAAAPTTVKAAPGATTPASAAGLAPARGFDGKTIKVGYLGNVSTSPQFPSSALFADGGKALTAGFTAYMSRINDAGGIAGKYKVDVNFKEMFYDAAEAAKKYTEIKDDSVLIGQIYGTPATQALRDSLKRDNLIASPISLDAEWVTGDNFLPIGTTYQAHAINGVEWYLKEGGGAGKTICSLTIAPNPYGAAYEEGYDFVAKKVTFKNGGKFRWSSADAVAQQLKEAKCDAVANAISGELHMPALLTAGDKIGYNPIYISSSPSFASRRVTSANSKLFGDQVIIVGDGAQWGDPKIPGMKDFIADITKYADEYVASPNPAALWGWAQARTVVALLENAVKLGDLSPAGMGKALATLGKVDHGGVYPAWDYTTPSTRVAPTPNWIGKADVSIAGAIANIKQWDSPVAKEYKR
jgi:Periplasmic binding protein